MYSSIVGKLLPGIWLGEQQTIGRNGVEGSRESEMVVNALFYRSIEGILRYPSLCAPSLVKFVPAIARLFCLALPWSFLTMFAQNKGDLCSERVNEREERQAAFSHIHFMSRSSTTPALLNPSLLQPLLCAVLALGSPKEGWCQCDCRSLRRSAG